MKKIWFETGKTETKKKKLAIQFDLKKIDCN